MNKNLVSIVMPTYNRAKFLPQAFASIQAQQWTDWELIVIDDGSMDETRQVVDQLSRNVSQRVRYVFQENQGPAEARNRGLDLAIGTYVAFFDSDDEWLPHHLAQAVSAFERNLEVDWIFSASRRIDFSTQNVLMENSFREKTSRFLTLSTRRSGDLYIIDDPDLRCCGFRGSGFGGMQCTIARRKVFDRIRFESCAFFEDRIILMRAIDNGVKFGYFDTINVLVYTHSSNVSFANPQVMRDRLSAFQTYVSMLERLRREMPRSRSELKAFDGRLSHEYFWSLAYPMFQTGEHKDALSYMSRAIHLCPTNYRFLKAYLTSVAKLFLGLAPKPRNS